MIRRAFRSASLVVMATTIGTVAAAAGSDPLARVDAGLDGAPPATVNVAQLRHQTRNHRAIADLVAALPAARRPAHILYLGSGSHLAALAACGAAPADTACTLVFTEIDPTVEDSLAVGLANLLAVGVISDLSSGEPLAAANGTRTWHFALDGRPVSLTLEIAAAASDPPLVRPGLLDGVDLVISHDWSGDPLGNLQVIQQLLAAVRSTDRQQPPLLMIEDLAAHPYPIDLALLSPIAHTDQPYGHRASDAGLGRHGDTELGAPLFGGGVVLGFDDPWWRQVDEATVASVLDLLVLAAFDDERQNVLEGGAEPVLAPAALDWWTGYGTRTLSVPDLRSEPLARLAAVDAATAIVPLLAPGLGRRLACQLRLYRCLLEARAAGFEVRSLMPAAAIAGRLRPAELPSEEMRLLYRDALRHIGEMRTERERVVTETAPVLARLRSEELQQATSSCPCALPADATADAWAAAYRAHLAWLEEQ